MNIIERKIEELTPYRGNPRRNANAVASVAESIRQFGFRQPLVVDSDGVIVCGHTRLEAAKLLKMTTVPCVLIDDLPPNAIRAYRLLDNKLHEKSEWDYAALVQELGELEFNFDPFDVNFEPPEFSLEPDEDDGAARVCDDPSRDDAGRDDFPRSWELVVKCDDEESQRELFERLTDEGYEVRLCSL